MPGAWWVAIREGLVIAAATGAVDAQDPDLSRLQHVLQRIEVADRSRSVDLLREEVHLVRALVDLLDEESGLSTEQLLELSKYMARFVADR